MITIIDYKAGNLTSVARALAHLGLAARITADPEAVRRADRIIFPGVGHAGTAMAVLEERGLDMALREAFHRGTPILGTCVGAQILLSHSEEGPTACLDLIAGDCVRFDHAPGLKVPHMGWNTVRFVKPHPVLEGIADHSRFYFVHSYYLRPADPANVYGSCDYGMTFAAMIGSGNLFATQFHSEKSGALGLSLMSNFARWSGEPC
ncbi:MAG: imidazole glycerol phosphate synthase subunit HisH [Hyphomicrobiales bacterium]